MPVDVDDRLQREGMSAYDAIGAPATQWRINLSSAFMYGLASRPSSP